MTPLLLTKWEGSEEDLFQSFIKVGHWPPDTNTFSFEAVEPLSVMKVMMKRIPLRAVVRYSGTARLHTAVPLQSSTI